MKNLKNKTVFITGASSGIGETCAKQFALQGARLILCARRIEKLNALAAEIKSEFGSEVHTVQLDVSQSDQVMECLSLLPTDFKHIDILINNAGLGLGLDPIQDGKIQDWDEMINTNIKGLLYVTRAILPEMVAKNAGHIINIGSVAGHTVYPKGAVYCATKFAVNALSQGFRMDLFGTKIRVTSIDPGAVVTNFSNVRFKGDTERAAAVYEGMEALTPEDIADAIVYCATRPDHVNISEMIIMPTAQAAATMISRRTKE